MRLASGSLTTIAVLLLAYGAHAMEAPDQELTPGAIRPSITKQIACSTKWGKDVRHVSDALKRQILTEYGYPLGNKDPRGPFEVDHRVPRSEGGADTAANLMAQSFKGPWNAHDKDRLEWAVHRKLCSSSMTLHEAQAIFLGDWRAAYVEWVPSTKAMNSGRRK